MLLSRLTLVVSFLFFTAYRPTNSIADSYRGFEILKDSSHKILFASFSHTFSNAYKKDLFRISISGKTLISGQVVFEIFDSKSKKIFKETFPALDLLGDKEDVLTTSKQKEDEIKRRIKRFFASKNFLVPAISSNQKFDADSYEQESWNEIKADPSITGFSYQHGYEGNYRIAYSKKKKKVVQYFYSD